MSEMRLSQQKKRQKSLDNHQLQTSLFAQTDWCLHPLAAYDNVFFNIITDSVPASVAFFASARSK